MTKCDERTSNNTITPTTSGSVATSLPRGAELLHVPRPMSDGGRSRGNKRVVTKWDEPLKVQKAAAKAGEYKTVFACSYSDFFMEEADQWRDEAWEMIRATPNLIWQLTSKRTHLIADRLPPDWGDGYPNVWLGTSVELKKYLPRRHLNSIPCVLRWVDFSRPAGTWPPQLYHW